MKKGEIEKLRKDGLGACVKGIRQQEQGRSVGVVDVVVATHSGKHTAKCHAFEFNTNTRTTCAYIHFILSLSTASIQIMYTFTNHQLTLTSLLYSIQPWIFTDKHSRQTHGCLSSVLDDPKLQHQISNLSLRFSQVHLTVTTQVNLLAVTPSGSPLANLALTTT